MTTRQFTSGVTAATQARFDRRVEESYDRLVTGDTVKVTGLKGDFKFLNATYRDEKVDHLTVLGPLGDRQMMRAFAPERVPMPSQRALNAQRRRKEADQ